MVMRCLVEQNAGVANVLQQTASSTEKVGHEVSAAIVAMQFQDLTSQRLGNIKTLLANLADALGGLQDIAGKEVQPADDRDLQERAMRLVECCTLSEMRKRLSGRLLTGAAATTHADAPASLHSAPESGGVELF
jgi:methyl-accepting chemotaxis protein